MMDESCQSKKKDILHTKKLCISNDVNLKTFAKNLNNVLQIICIYFKREKALCKKIIYDISGKIAYSINTEDYFRNDIK